jgi:hypothetical protein
MMNTSRKPNSAATAAARPPKESHNARTHQAGVAQAKSVAPPAKPPAPPPAYRPQAAPKVLQTKKNGGPASVNNEKARAAQPPSAKPRAPHSYRPQAVPKVLQTKKAGGQQPTPARPAGRTLPHSPPTANSVQPKMRGGGQHRGGGSVVQRETTGAFRQNAIKVNSAAEGGQNATIEVTFLDFSNGDPPTRRVYQHHHFYPQHGQHSERVLMDAALNTIAGLGVAAHHLRVTHVQIYTRFNPCNDCTNRMVAFKQTLAVRASNNAGQTVFDVAYTDHLYVAHGQSLADAQFAKEANSTKLRTAGWNVTQGLSAPVMTTSATLGSAGDPIVID